MHSLVAVERVMEGVPVALSLHIVGFNFPFFKVVRHPTCSVLIEKHVSEVIQRQILNLGMVTIGEVNHVRCELMIELSIMSSAQQFEPIP